MTGYQALANGIIEEGQFEDYNADAARAQCAVLLSRAIPAEELDAVNTVEDGAIVVDRQMATSIPGVFAAGDCTGEPLQVSKAMGEGQIAGLSAAAWCARTDK